MGEPSAERSPLLAPAALGRLREADVVRLCGLNDAAHGLELAVFARACRREHARLLGVVPDAPTDAADPPDAARVWVAFEDAAPPPGMRWRCSLHSPATDVDGVSGRPGCAHVAALLSAWLRAPEDFAVEGEPAPAPARSAPPPAAHPARTGAAPEPHARLAGASPPPQSLRGALERLPNEALRALAGRVVRAEHDGPAPDELNETLDRLDAALSDPQRVGALVERLDPRPRALLAEIDLLGGALTKADLDALAQRAGATPSAYDEAARALARSGLLFAALGAPAGEAPTGARGIAGWRIAPEVRAALRLAPPLAPLPPHALAPAPRARQGGMQRTAAFTDAPEEQGLGDRDSRPLRAQRSSPRALLATLALLPLAPQPLNPLSVQAEPAEARRPRADQRATPAIFPLVAGDLPTGALDAGARSLGVAPGALRLARRVLLVSRTRPVGAPLRELARLPAGERGRALHAGFRLWRDAELPMELADLDPARLRLRVDATHPALQPATLAAEVAGARRFALDALARLPAEVWYALDDALELFWRLDPLLLRRRQTTYERPAWYLERAGERRPLRATVHDDWRAGEGEIIRALLTGPLAWWGALDLATDATGAPVAFRLTPWGASLLTAERADAEAPLPEMDAWGPAITLTKSGALAAHPLATGAALLDELERWARVTALAPGRLVYELDADRACAAFDRGATPDTLLARLRASEGETRAGALLAERLGAWRARYGQTRLEAGWALLEAADAADLEEALAYAPELAARIRRVSATAALLPAGDAPALEAALAKRGYAR